MFPSSATTLKVINCSGVILTQGVFEKITGCMSTIRILDN
jgi:hypothetical protein